MERFVFKYVAERQARGEMAPKTAASARRSLIRFANSVGVGPDQLKRRHVERFMEASTHLAPGSRYRQFAILRVFCRWLLLNGHVTADPTVGIRPPKVPKSAPRRLNSTDATLSASCAPDLRGRVMVSLMLQEMLRCAEVAAVQMGDLDLIAHTLAVRGKGGQGGITRHLALSTETNTAINRYLDEHPASAGPLIRSYLYPTRPLTPHYVTQLVAEWMATAGVKRKPWDGRTAHALRHTGASDMADQGANVLEIQQALGHDSLSSTMIYLRGVTPNLRTAMGGRTYMPANLHPLDFDHPSLF